MLRQVRGTEVGKPADKPGAGRPRRKILRSIIETICWATWGLLALFVVHWLGVPEQYVAPVGLVMAAALGLPIAWCLYYRFGLRRFLAERKAFKEGQSKSEGMK
jgi:hypothetical protein